MKTLMNIKEEIARLEQDPQYVEQFGEILRCRWQDGSDQAWMEEMIHYFEDKNKHNVSNRLKLIQQKHDFQHGNLDKVITRGEGFRALFKEQCEIHSLLENDNILIRSYLYQGEFTKAIGCSAEALAMAEAEDHQEIHIKILLNTVRIYLYIKEYKRAEQVLEEVAHMSFFFNDNNKLLMTIDRAELYLRQGQTEQAFQQCQKAYQMAEKYGNVTGEKLNLCVVLNLRAHIYIQKKLWAQAEKDIKKALEITCNHGYQATYIGSLIGYGHYYYQCGELEAAREKLSEGIHQAEQMGAVYLKSQALSILSQVYEQLSCWKEALAAKREADCFFSALFQDKSCLWIEQLDTHHLKGQLERYKALYTQMEKIARLGASFTYSLSANNLKEVIFKEVTQLISLDFMGIAYMAEGTTAYQFFTQEGGRDCNEENELIKYTRYMAEYCIESQQGIMVNDGNFEAYTLSSIKDSITGAKLQSLVVSPLKVEEQVIGAVVVGSYHPDCYSENDLSFVKIIASYLAIALKNAGLYEEVCYLAEHDALTGVLSRGSVLKRGEALFKANRKHHKKMAIIMFDVDNFKQINDKYGHQFGDSVLQKVGEIIGSQMRKQDDVGRYGGEEFIAILDEISTQEVEELAGKINHQMATYVFRTKKEQEVSVTLSGGIYICNEYTLNFADGIRFADHALYRAKLLGRNRIVSYSLTLEG